MKLLLVCDEMKTIRTIYCLSIQERLFILNDLSFILRLYSLPSFLVVIVFLFQNNDRILGGSVSLFFLFCLWVLEKPYL